jgi:hypothetical chaperone protein
MRIGIGLDFGTTNSSIAIARPDRSSEAVLFASGEGKTETYRSVLYFEPKSPATTGPLAIERYLAADEKGRLILFSPAGCLHPRTFSAASTHSKT